MNLENDPTDLELRIAAATARCAVLRISGPLEAYMESFDEVEALELQLKTLTSGVRPGDS